MSHDVGKGCGTFIAVMLAAMTAAFAARFQKSRHLHGQGRAAGNDAVFACPLPRRAQHGERIDAAMIAKALVLVGDQQIEVAAIDVANLHRQTPAPIARRERP